ncbi:uncharacterized protein LOC123327567 isoform X1 [Bubalus bubalis]|uniref:uncharacterized protein LOC123327567 isoform X1 n=1 Tax=Bubalus bubalis TaxID=89462 RepID=UPI001E1B706B|nr:uncharacterized protein LOC123327567 isoform X1 [Bubalus bubalis]
MASPSSSPEDTGKLRGRDGRQRWEAEDAPPEEKRLRLGLEGGSAAREEGEDAPHLGREETGTQTGVEDGGDLPSLPYSLVEGQDDTSEHSACFSSANSSPHASVPEMFPAFTVPSSLLPDVSRMFNLVARSQSAVSLCISADPAMTSRGTWTFVSVVLY